jgi:hypothetical protein
MHTSDRLQRSRLALVTWGHFLNDCYGSFFAPTLPLLIDKLSLSLTMASGLASIASIAGGCTRAGSAGTYACGDGEAG